jgi:hypothetical protein
MEKIGDADVKYINIKEKTMNTPSHDHDRPYRKRINSHGWMYVGGESKEITVKNISITGALVQLNTQNEVPDKKHTLQNLAVSKSIDFYLPHLQLSGEAKVVRVDTTDDKQLLLAMEFQNIAYTTDKPVFNRKSYRKEVSMPGQLLVEEQPLDFVTVDISLEGLKIRVPEELDIEPGAVIPFQLSEANVKGLVKVVWAAHGEAHETLMGLQYVTPKKTQTAPKIGLSKPYSMSNALR